MKLYLNSIAIITFFCLVNNAIDLLHQTKNCHSVISASFHSKTCAFPRASGFGRESSGGRGDSIYHVTNLNDNGRGSFRDAVSRSHRFIVFDLSGVIYLKSKVSAASDLTIAGQSAPAMGLVIYGNGVSFSCDSNCIVRYLRFRGSIRMSRGTCTLSVDNCCNMIFDHVSVEWGRWDNLHIKDSRKITFQNCIIGEGINPQRFGALLENPDSLTVYHCLWIDNQSRNPKGKTLWMEFVNNVIYNWGSSGFIGGHSSQNHYEILLGNYFISGPSSVRRNFISNFTNTDYVYQKGNYVDTNANGQLDGSLIKDSVFGKQGASLYKLPATYGFSSDMEEAALAYRYVLKNVGDNFPHLDSVDLSLISQLISLGSKGSILQTDHDGECLKDIQSIRGASDLDRDGLPDFLEAEYGLSQHRYDAWRISSNGYTYLENYLNQLCQ